MYIMMSCIFCKYTNTLLMWWSNTRLLSDDDSFLQVAYTHTRARSSTIASRKFPPWTPSCRSTTCPGSVSPTSLGLPTWRRRSKPAFAVDTRLTCHRENRDLSGIRSSNINQDNTHPIISLTWSSLGLSRKRWLFSRWGQFCNINADQWPRRPG